MVFPAEDISSQPLAANLTWKQSSNPVLQASCDPVEGFETLPGHEPVFTSKTNDCSWGGLQRSCNANKALLDGCRDTNTWWFVVGARASYQNGIAAVSSKRITVSPAMAVDSR